MIHDCWQLCRDFGMRLAFWQTLLHHPRQVASFVASSRRLEQRLVQLAELRRAQFIVELGPGIGGTTRAFLQAMNLHATLLAIELIPSFARHLKTIRDPRLIVLEGDAQQLRSLLTNHPEVMRLSRHPRTQLGSSNDELSGIGSRLAPHGVETRPRPDCIIAGIPFSMLEPRAARLLVEQIHAALAPDGLFVAYQFRDTVAALAEPYFGAPEVFREIHNLPPLWIYRWRKQAAIGPSVTKLVTAPFENAGVSQSTRTVVRREPSPA